MFSLRNALLHVRLPQLTLWKQPLRAMALFLSLGLLLAHSVIPHDHTDTQSNWMASSPVGFDLGMDHLSHFTVAGADAEVAFGVLAQQGLRNSETPIFAWALKVAQLPVQSPQVTPGQRQALGHAQSWAHRPPPVLV